MGHGCHGMRGRHALPVVAMAREAGPGAAQTPHMLACLVVALRQRLEVAKASTHLSGLCPCWLFLHSISFLDHVTSLLHVMCFQMKGNGQVGRIGHHALQHAGQEPRFVQGASVLVCHAQGILTRPHTVMVRWIKMCTS